MGTHPAFEELIAYAAGELDAAAAFGVAEHLTTCAECAATVDRFRWVQSVLKTDDSVFPPCATLERALALADR